MNGSKRLFFICRAVFLLTLSIMVLPVTVKAQEPVPVAISQQKIVAEGKVYYMHQVLKGQTLYSIARAYAVPVDLISRENNLAGNAIKEGQLLRIPAAVSDQGQAAIRGVASQGQTSDRNAATSQGQAAGSSNSRPPETPATQDERYLYHRVKSGETLGTIAGDYGISVRDLKRANRGLLFPHEGDYLLIPRNKITDPEVVSRVEATREDMVQDSVVADTSAIAEEPELFTILAEKTRIERLSGSVRVAVMFPFFIKENSRRTYIDSTGRDSRGNTLYREVKRDPADIYDGSLPFIEAYEGILVAVDSLRTLGLTVELDVYDTGADSAELKRILRNGLPGDVDLVIGPVFSHNLGQISGWASEQEIPFVSPVALRDAHIHYGKPFLYRMFPSQYVAQDAMAAEVARHPESRVVFLHADSAMYDPATVRLWEKIRGAGGFTDEDTSVVVPERRIVDTSRTEILQRLQEASVIAEPQTGEEDTRIVSHWFTGATAKRDSYGSIAALDSLLDSDRENIIVLASTSTPVVSSVFSALHSLTKRYKIRVIGYPEIRGLETIDLRYYYDLELLIPSESYIDYESPAVHAFTSSYRSKFKTEPIAESFAWRGFDIAWYFIGGIATGGSDFLRDPGTFNPSLLCLEPDFRRDNRQNGYENRGLFFLQYRKDMTIEVRRPLREAAPVKEYNERFSSPFSGSSGGNRAR